MSNCSNYCPWDDLDWKDIHYRVRKLQKRIALAVKNKDWHKMYELQKLVYNSRCCRIVAVQRVTSRKNIRTPGIDGKFWSSDREKYAAVELMDYRNYFPKPFKRIYVPKDHDKSKKRPLSIPIIFDRAMQGLFLIAVDPVIETIADTHAYGFRKYRSSQDVAKDILERFGFDRGNVWVLKADVKECFDHLSHKWILDHAPMNKKLLQSILSCGYKYKGIYYPTIEGMPQGGVLSPVFTTFTLCGFENILIDKYFGERIEMIRFVDDFLFAADSQDILIRVIDDLRNFLGRRGLELSPQKTKILHISDGVDFIGWNFRRDDRLIVVTPSKQSLDELQKRLYDIVNQGRNWTIKRLICKLNGVIRGWGGYHMYLCSIDILICLDDYLQDLLWSWALRKYSSHTSMWAYSHCWKYVDSQFKRVFCSGGVSLLRFSDMRVRVSDILDLSKNPYIDHEYFQKRRKSEYKYSQNILPIKK